MAQTLAALPSRSGGSPQLLVSSPWISTSAKAELEASGISYVDDVGNMRVVVQHLPVLITSQGAQSNPRPRRATRVRLSGDAALAVVRYLTDVVPPCSPSDIVKATELSAGYVSKLLSALDETKLISRDGPEVVGVDWPELLRERASQAPPLLGSDRYTPMLSREGLATTLTRLHQLRPADDEPLGWVTGSAAAQRLAPIAPTTQLAIWTNSPAVVRRRLGLLPAGDGPADVLLLTKNVQNAVRGATERDGIPYVAPSQVALDCLTGNGRMPAEGEAVIAWMAEHEVDWRHGHLGDRTLSRVAGHTWTAASAEALLDLLETSGPAQAAVLRAAAESPHRFVSRLRTYKLAGFDPSRSLRGFTRPVNSAQSRLSRSGLVPPLAAPALQTKYGHGESRALGFAIPEDLATALQA